MTESRTKKSEKYNFWLRKSPKILKPKYDWVICERIKRGKDKKPISYTRVDKMLSRYNKFWEDAANADLID